MQTATTPLGVTGGKWRKWRSGSACPGTDLRPAGAAQAGVGSRIAPTRRDKPEKAGRGHAYKKKGAGSETRTSTTNFFGAVWPFGGLGRAGS
ncbi:hypothetical protein GCM10010109_36070 [Actinoplanes campanulatus]|nr:hypothetical protein GCM10010109_36070 [Actinoplanes campanulatus]GID35543.1 hypothetical protein Aca09nite_20490 [Actinoplanes campanulatus]